MGGSLIAVARRFCAQAPVGLFPVALAEIVKIASFLLAAAGATHLFPVKGAVRLCTSLLLLPLAAKGTVGTSIVFLAKAVEVAVGLLA